MKASRIRTLSLAGVAVSLWIAAGSALAHDGHYGYAPRYVQPYRQFTPPVVTYGYPPAPVYYAPPQQVYAPAPAYYGRAPAYYAPPVYYGPPAVSYGARVGYGHGYGHGYRHR